MKIDRYIPIEEVQRACRELELRDWTQLTSPQVSEAEARRVLEHLDPGGLVVDLEDFRQGLEIELKHGRFNERFNVTNNHPLLTGMIVLANLQANAAHYRLVRVSNVETRLAEAIDTGDIKRIDDLYDELVDASKRLCQPPKSAFE